MEIAKVDLIAPSLSFSQKLGFASVKETAATEGRRKKKKEKKEKESRRNKKEGTHCLLSTASAA